MTGGKKLKSEGVLDEAKGKVPNAVGGIKDAIKGKKRGPSTLSDVSDMRRGATEHWRCWRSHMVFLVCV